MSRTRGFLVLALCAAAALVLATTGMAHVGGAPGTGGEYDPIDAVPVQVPRAEKPCPDAHPEWRPAQTVEGVEVLESQQCHPDNPKLVAAFVKGTNAFNESYLRDLALHEEAVVKGPDLDGDGDPDVINITLEVNEINGWHLADDVLAGEGFAIAPGIEPAFWVFSPKTTIHHGGEPFSHLVRMPSPPIRVEQGDRVRITIENTHYFPHTLHLHGVDHPFVDASGEGNDGVPHASEDPILPGEKRTYEITPRVAGTMFSHCHVQPQAHVLMGLNLMMIVEEDRPDNWLQTLNVGGGDVRHPSKAVRETYDREYDLHYQEVHADLHAIPQQNNDPRWIAREMNRVFDITDAKPDYFLLNGRSFPYTLRESQIIVAPDELVKLRVLNGGSQPVALHLHGHKPTVTALDGVPLLPGARYQRDVHWITAASRLDLDLNTTNDGLHAFGDGAWFAHDHQEQGVANDGVGPGGDVTTVTYESWIDNETNLPRTNGMSWDHLFTSAYHRGEIPVWHMLDPGGPFGGQLPEDAYTVETDDRGGVPGFTAGMALASLAGVLVLAWVAGRLGARGGRR